MALWGKEMNYPLTQSKDKDGGIIQEGLISYALCSGDSTLADF